MQPEYLSRLSESLQNFVQQVERGANINVQVVLDSKLNASGPNKKGKLKVIIEANYAQLIAPTNGYFPDGAVRHEMLHVKRFHIDGIPKLSLSDDEDWDKTFSDNLGALDNAIEHIIIVPVELQLHPERRQHWETVMGNICTALHLIPERECCLVCCLHWAFFWHVLPNSPHVKTLKNFLIERSLLEIANNFIVRFLSVRDKKEEMIRVLFSAFPEIPANRVALEYINSSTGTHQIPVIQKKYGAN